VTGPKKPDHKLIDVTSATPEKVEDVVDLLEAVQQSAEAKAQVGRRRTAGKLVARLLRIFSSGRGPAPTPRYDKDGVACFNHLYTKITNDVLAKVRQGSYFTDQKFIETLDVEFAKRYLDAVRCDALGGCDASGQPTPRSWDVLFHHRAEAIRPIQFAVAGVNAHVNYDLAFALVETCQVLGQPLGQGSQHDDYLKINEIFADHMRELRHDFQGQLEREFDRWIVAGLADDAGDLTVVLARDAAWRRAERLWELRDDAEKMAKEDKAIDWRVSMMSHGILAF
jgi:hypothetical protein